MARLYINQTLESEIREYCELNGIEDVNAFANRCAKKGLSVVMYGMDPIDNINRERSGINDLNKKESKNENKTKPKKSKRDNNVEGLPTEEIKQVISGCIKEEDSEQEKKASEPINVTSVRKIKIIKK